MQRSIWLLALLPHLHWLGSLVDGATVLTSPSSFTPILQPQSLNNSNGLDPGIIVIDKERGDELSAYHVLEAGVSVISEFLADEDFSGFMKPEAWVWEGTILSVSVNEQGYKNQVQRAFVIEGIYLILLLMKKGNDFRSGVFEIHYDQVYICDINILSTKGSGLKNLPNFSHITQLAPPSPSLVHNTNSSSPSNETVSKPPSASLAYHTNETSQSDASAQGNNIDYLLMRSKRLDEYQWLDRLDLLLNLADLLLTTARPNNTDRIKGNIEIAVPDSGVKTYVYPVIDAPPRWALTYEAINWVVRVFFEDIVWEGPATPGFSGMLVNNGFFIGWVLIGPSNSSAPTSMLAGANFDTSAGTATARKRRFMG